MKKNGRLLYIVYAQEIYSNLVISASAFVRRALSYCKLSLSNINYYGTPYRLHLFFLRLSSQSLSASNVKRYDAIIIGAGHNGLTYACYLGKA